MYSLFCETLPPDIIKKDEPMKNHTTFRIGGPVDIMVSPHNINELQQAINICRQNDMPFFILGLGSNILVRDKGYRGVAIKIGNNLKRFTIEGEKIIAEAGIRLSELSRKASASSLSGLEFAEGIPGSLGGAIVMNAGAYDGEMKNVIISVKAINKTGQIELFKHNELNFNYRKSIFQENGYIVISALIKLSRGNKKQIQEKMREFAQRRREKQPLEYPSAGSVFKRPEGLYVGPMLEKMGLKGFSIGGAQVSSKHAGFIINTGDAKASDVLDLIEYIQLRSQQDFGVNLQPEIIIIGEK